jgi:CheY-like chemotaxis protein
MADNILIIDDDKWIAMSTSMVLEEEGFEVHSSLGGLDGLEKARKLAPKVILLDIMMPGMDGWETLDRLRADPQTREIPVVVFTAREQALGRRRATANGAEEYLQKPFRPATLVKILKRLIESEVKA